MRAKYTRMTDSEWDKIKEFLPIGRKRKHDLREVLDGIFWITRTGSQWRNLDSQFPRWEVVYYYFHKWTKGFRIEALNDALNRLERIKMRAREDSPSVGIVDSQSVRLNPMIETARGIDGNKHINGRKRSLLTDTSGRIWRVEVDAANVHDGQAGLALLSPYLNSQLQRMQLVVGDKAYRGIFAESVRKMGVAFECPTAQKERKGFEVEPKRWVVERTFAWFNFFRRITKDYERTVESAVAFIYLANIQMVLANLSRFDE